MTQPVLDFKGVVKSYADNKVLEGVDLTVGVGEFFALVGANGQGKTTLMKGLLDFIEVDAGEIEIGGQTHRLPRSREPLAYLPERFIPPPFLSGRHFLRYFMRLHSRPFQEDAVERLLEALDFDPAALDQSVGSYSKGMIQKLGLMGCLLSEKPLLLLDEPMSGLDPKARVLLKQELLRLKGKGGSLFFSTHLLTDVEELCDRMAILHKGRLRFVGSPQGCRERFPAQSLEGSFIRCIESDIDFL
ncbi:MAG: ABC transporter ATP-binding protein [Magnetococcales bacterium]|nr:ABC transporter ATP-binding protein [Magnetococcales bacterium]